MNHALESAQTKNIPAKAWVRFLRTYGPTPNGAAMFDEHVAKAARQAKVVPIELPLPLLPKMLESIEHQICGALLIAGTAGDGKTYHCRALWHDLGGDAATWDNGCSVKRLTLQNGRKVYFVKDLSELNESDNSSMFNLLEQVVLGNNDSDLLVMAANHGQILECLRKRRYQEYRAHPLKLHLEAVFLQAGEGHPRLQVFDLSRSTHRKSLTDVLDVLTNHPEWEKCHSCQFQKYDNIVGANLLNRRVTERPIFKLAV